MIKTEFLNDFVEYYRKAHTLQTRNKGESPVTTTCDDPLMDNVTIYDTINRKFAGFSKALEDIHGVRVRKDLIRYANFSESLRYTEFHFLHLFHRFTGSGASFQPTYLPNGERNPKEHGYCNNKVQDVACQLESFSFEGARQFIAECTDPMVTSVGNQPPSLKNGNPEKYRLAMQYYFDNYAQSFVLDYLKFLNINEEVNNKPLGIKEAVDFSCNWHKERGFKQWHFILTAFVMDTAEYYPELVDQTSHCYYGANCIKAFDLMFTKEKTDSKKKDQWYEDCMSELVKLTGGRPYDLEDVCCDVIRYWNEYVPKGYESLPTEKRKNNSTLKVNGVYPETIQLRIDEVLG